MVAADHCLTTVAMSHTQPQAGACILCRGGRLTCDLSLDPAVSYILANIDIWVLINNTAHTTHTAQHTQHNTTTIPSL